ncbi:MAG: hypothetical protein HFE83_02460 [Lachnospiraceae bacterium]|jgi:hypothetical protein|nr:hypothetical protein [Lachnospiraceae bacterium]
MGSLQGLIDKGLAEEGYVEKASLLGLDSKTANKGNQNYTKYARDVDAAGLMGCQAQPWCCTFQFWLEMQEFGAKKALEHWNMKREDYMGYNCFATYNAFKKAGRVGMTPRLGAVVIFDFSHAGRVVRTYSKNGQQWFDCLEGNTSANLSDRNGGQVKIKTRPWNDSTVKGFCYVDYAAEEPAGWVHDATGWWYREEDGSYPQMMWKLINHHWYCFGRSGYMLTGWIQWNGKKTGMGDWYYLEESGEYEGACWHEKSGGKGALERWSVEE